MATSEFADISADELREKYEEERLKRLRSEGNEQYVELKQYKDFDADPYTPLQPRDPMTIETEVLIVGAGWGGMTTAAFLRKNGVDDFRIIDKAGDFIDDKTKGKFHDKLEKVDGLAQKLDKTDDGAADEAGEGSTED